MRANPTHSYLQVPAGQSPRLLWRASRHGCCGASLLSRFVPVAIRGRRRHPACPRAHRGQREWHQRGGRGRGGDKLLCCGEAASAPAPRERAVQGRGGWAPAVGGGGGEPAAVACRPRPDRGAPFRDVWGGGDAPPGACGGEGNQRPWRVGRSPAGEHRSGRCGGRASRERHPGGGGGGGGSGAGAAADAIPDAASLTASAGRLVVVADDTLPRWVTRLAAVDYATVAVAVATPGRTPPPPPHLHRAPWTTRRHGHNAPPLRRPWGGPPPPPPPPPVHPSKQAAARRGRRAPVACRRHPRHSPPFSSPHDHTTGGRGSPR